MSDDDGDPLVGSRYSLHIRNVDGMTMVDMAPDTLGAWLFVGDQDDPSTSVPGVATLHEFILRAALHRALNGRDCLRRCLLSVDAQLACDGMPGNSPARLEIRRAVMTCEAGGAP